MKQSIHFLVFEMRYAQLWLGGGLLIAFVLTFYLLGIFTPAEIPWYFDNETEFLGMIILIVLIPPYVAVCFLYSMRRSLLLARQIDEQNGTQLVKIVSSVPTTGLLIGLILGLTYALTLNIPGNMLEFFSWDTPHQGATLGQIIIWVLVGMFGAVRIHIARAFRHSSQEVDVDIFETSNLKPYGQLGLIDALTIVGGLLVSTVQSLDFSFRPDNYVNALIVLIPGLIYLVIYPMWDLHKRLLQQKTEQLTALNLQIAKATKTLEAEAMISLEVLLQRRERVSNLPTWPIDIAFVQRILFYIVIPPLAWVAGALVEMIVEGQLS